MVKIVIQRNSEQLVFPNVGKTNIITHKEQIKLRKNGSFAARVCYSKGKSTETALRKFSESKIMHKLIE